jgi:imidazolonepropionase-like amidohydrolase
MAGAPVKNAVILIRDGKIEKVGQDLAIPRDCPVVEAGDFVVMPGLVSPRSHIGISSNWRRQSSIDEISKPVVPELEVKHAVEPQAPLFFFARELGISTVLVTPGNRNLIGGQGAVFKTRGDVVDQMIIKDRAAMVFGFGVSAKRSDQMPSTRMGIAALMRETMVKAQEYRESREKYEKEKKGAAPERDLSLESLIPVLRGELPVLVHAERRDDILTALRIADEFKLKIILDGATDAYKVASEIKKRGIPVVLEDLFRGAGNIEDRGFNPKNPSILSRAGIPIAFRASEGSWYVPGSGEAGGDLLEIAAFAVKHGLPEDAALRAVTIDAARIIGLEKRIGSLEPGKDADILVLRGHPFLTKSVPEALFIEGKPVYERQEGARLGKSR